MAPLDHGPFRHPVQLLARTRGHEQRPVPRVAGGTLDAAQQALVDQFLESVQDLDARSMAAVQTDSTASRLMPPRTPNRRPTPPAPAPAPVAPADRGAAGSADVRRSRAPPTRTAEHAPAARAAKRQQHLRPTPPPARSRAAGRRAAAIPAIGSALSSSTAKPAGRPRRAGEQAHRLAACDWPPPCTAVPAPATGTPHFLLAGDVQRRAARHHEPQRRRSPQDLRHRRSGHDQVLEVLQHDEPPHVLEVTAQPVPQRPVALVPQPDGLRDRRKPRSGWPTRASATKSPRPRSHP